MGKIPYIVITQYVMIYFAKSQQIASFYVLRHLSFKMSLCVGGIYEEFMVS